MKENYYLGHCLQVAMTKIPQTGGLKQQTFVPHSSGGQKIQDQDTGQFGSCKNSLPDFRLLFSHCIFIWWEEGKRALWGPFYKGAKPIYEGFTLMT